MTETSIETKRQYLGAIEDLADRLRRDLELAVSKANPEPMTPDPEYVPTPAERIDGLEKVLKTAEVALRTAAEERERLQGQIGQRDVRILTLETAVENLVAERDARGVMVDNQFERIQKLLREAEELDRRYLHYKNETEKLCRAEVELNNQIVEERRRVDFLDGKLQERDKQVEALQFELEQTKLQLTDRDDAIESLVKRIGAIRHAADLAAEWP